MKRYIDLSVTVDDFDALPPSTNMKLEITRTGAARAFGRCRA